MSKILCVSALLLASPALAHVKIGEYAGQTPEGAACTLSVTAVTFENGVHHPLNERVQVEGFGTSVVLSHPAVIDAPAGLASFNHDVLQGVLATDVGAKALVLEVSHAEGSDGPTAFRVVDHDWSLDAGAVQTCLGLKFSLRRAPAAR